MAKLSKDEAKPSKITDTESRGTIRPLTEYGFSEEEAQDVALLLYLFDTWTEEFLAEPQDPRYTKLIREYTQNTDAGVLLMTGFLGGVAKWIDVELKADLRKEGNG